LIAKKKLLRARLLGANVSRGVQIQMARANRHYLPGYVWHITHRCHKREFLLKFSKDKKRWLSWLFEAKKRYGLSILNYTVTSNHIHLLLFDNKKDTIKKDTIPKSIQLLAGRTAREFNQRKKLKEHSGKIVITRPLSRLMII
jgi:REP element-mobilizing transposase RayT